MFGVFEQESEILKAIANKYGIDSKEYAAIRVAAFALLFALTEHANEFKIFVKEHEQELTAEQRKRPRELGLLSE